MQSYKTGGSWLWGSLCMSETSCMSISRCWEIVLCITCDKSLYIQNYCSFFFCLLKASAHEFYLFLIFSLWCWNYCQVRQQDLCILGKLLMVKVIMKDNYNIRSAHPEWGTCSSTVGVTDSFSHWLCSDLATVEAMMGRFFFIFFF